ncbi:hypothetical protein [Paenibacillus elgii]|uniref:hypothetical protein n=1 Tax=Paenibacillus elgii TaxID=189691 RepID=UPI00203AEA78|nr:hypothetical protein [Paenibacillus elgii]MCM3273048.1 hypothetical protein [Paenibacillus elgii]
MREDRLSFLKRVYDETNGRQFSYVNMWEIGESMGLSTDDVDKITDYLDGEGLIVHGGLGGDIGITHKTVKFFTEEAPLQAAPIVNHYNINMHNSQAQIATVHSSQNNYNSLMQPTTDEIKSFLELLKSKILSLELDEDIKDELIADVEIADKQINSETPRMDRIMNRISSIIYSVGEKYTREILESAPTKIMDWIKNQFTEPTV